MVDGEKKSQDYYFEELDNSGATSIRDLCRGKLTMDRRLQHWKGCLVLLIVRSEGWKAFKHFPGRWDDIIRAVYEKETQREKNHMT